jgi:hypothetical protein
VSGAGRPLRLVRRASGLLLTAAVAAGFVWAGARWLALGLPEAEPDPAALRRNERLAYQRLGTIIRAQRRYRQRDWDGDGKKTYAAFQIHLWRSVDRRGKPVPVNLIPRRLGFAMVATFALDGYVFRDIHQRAPIASLRRQTGDAAGRLDPAREWALAALPVAPGRSGVLPFIAHSSGRIWTHAGAGSTGAPASGGAAWVEVRSAEQLRRIQDATRYQR